MDITLPRTRHIDLPKKAFVLLRMAISAAALCVICLVAAEIDDAGLGTWPNCAANCVARN